MVLVDASLYQTGPFEFLDFSGLSKKIVRQLSVKVSVFGRNPLKVMKRCLKINGNLNESQPMSW